MGSVVSAARGTSLARSLDSGNALLNSEYDHDNYPVWTSWNGLKLSSTYNRNIGSFKGIANWVHYSPLFNQGYSTYIGNQFLFLDRRHSPNDLAGYLAGYQPRVIKLYGAENLWGPGQVSQGSVSNDNADRGDSTKGIFTDAGNSRIVSNTTLSSISSSTSMTSTSCWTRSTEWQQHLSIPDNCTSIKFGAQIRVQATDKLRPLNFAGIYCAEDAGAAGQHYRKVNYFAIRHTSATFSLPTGTLTGDQGSYNWNGLVVGDSHSYYRFYTPSNTTVTEHAMLDQDDYEDFKRVEYTFTPSSTGTNRKMSLNLFFAENASYLKAAANGLTGGFQVYDPFVEFLTS